MVLPIGVFRIPKWRFEIRSVVFAGRGYLCYNSLVMPQRALFVTSTSGSGKTLRVKLFAAGQPEERISWPTHAVQQSHKQSQF